MEIIGERIKNVVYNKRPGVYVIVERKCDDKIAIVSNADEVYFFLGGGIENNETELEALKREVIEETGYTLTNIRYFDKNATWCYSKTHGYIYIEATFYIANFEQKITEPIEKDHRLFWVDPRNYVEKLYREYQRYILRKYCDHKFRK